MTKLGNFVTEEKLSERYPQEQRTNYHLGPRENLRSTKAVFKISCLPSLGLFFL